MPDDHPSSHSRGSRPWLITMVASGLLLAIAIVTGLSSSLGRLGKTMDLLDQPGTHPEEFSHLAEESARVTTLSLYAGLPIALIYLTALIMYRRSKAPR